jgi:hypothetical protein
MKELTIWQLLVHDLSKFTLYEFWPYAKHFQGNMSPVDKEHDADLDVAWNRHQKLNKHHPEFWMVLNQQAEVTLLPMPRRYVLEMIADWMGASIAYTGKRDMTEWLKERLAKMRFERGTRQVVECILSYLGYDIAELLGFTRDA